MIELIQKLPLGSAQLIVLRLIRSAFLIEFQASNTTDDHVKTWQSVEIQIHRRIAFPYHETARNLQANEKMAGKRTLHFVIMDMLAELF